MIAEDGKSFIEDGELTQVIMLVDAKSLNHIREDLDNASIHHSNKFVTNIPQWEAK